MDNNEPIERGDVGTDGPSSELVDEASADSFPASDPPGWTAGADDSHADTIPDFRLPASTGQTLERDAYVGKVRLATVVLASDGADDVRGILDTLNRHFREFGKRSCQLLVFMPATASEVRDIAKELDIRYPILADPTNSYARASGAASATGEPTPSALIAARDGTVYTRMRGLSDGFVKSMLESVDDLDDHAS